MMKLMRLSMLLAALLPAVAMAAPYKMVAYYLPSQQRQYSAADIDASKMTHLNYAFALIKDGEIAPDQSSGTDQSARDYIVLRGLKSRAPKLKTLISVGGWA